MESTRTSRVCVTGASGFIGSWMVKKLLENGHTVHGTIRNLGDESKVGLLKSLPGAEKNLILFEADLYKASSKDFDNAIEGCEFVFHVATPWVHDNSQTSLYKDTSEAAVAGVRLIAESCIRSQSVKRLIYTASLTATSRHTDDGLGFRACIDESCFTPLNLSYSGSQEFITEYVKSKTLAEKEILSFNELENCKLEVVSLACGCVGGDTLLPYLSVSLELLCSIINGNQELYKLLIHTQDIMGSIPLVHMEDVCGAHIFCMEKPSMRGRFICGVANPTLKAIALYFQENFPEYEIANEVLIEGPEKGTPYDFTKLTKMGFQYNYDMTKILNDTVACGKRFGAI